MNLGSKNDLNRKKIGCQDQLFLVYILRGPVYHSYTLFLLEFGYALAEIDIRYAILPKADIFSPD